MKADSIYETRQKLTGVWNLDSILVYIFLSDARLFADPASAKKRTLR